MPPGELGPLLRAPEPAAVWVDVLRPANGAVRLLRDTLNLGELTVEDCTRPLRMPKFDVLRGDGGEDPGGAFVAAFAVRVEEDGTGPRLRAPEVDLVAGDGHLVTVSDEPVRELDDRLRSLLEDDGLPPPQRPGFAMAHAALDALVDGQQPAMALAAERAEELEEALDPRNDRASLAALEGLITLRRDLAAFRRLAVAQQEVLRRLGRVAPELRGRLSDVADNAREAIDMADAVRD